jgi:hypothetical protein
MRLTEAAKALATRDHVRGISGLSALSNTMSRVGATTPELAGYEHCLAVAAAHTSKFSHVSNHAESEIEQIITVQPFNPVSK